MKFINFSQFKHYYILKGINPYKTRLNDLLDMLEFEYKLPIKTCESVFFARNKTHKNEMGLIFHDGEGVVVVQKKFDAGHLVWPPGRAGMIDLTEEQLERFLSGYPITSSIG